MRRRACATQWRESVNNEKKGSTLETRKAASLGDRRRKHRHWEVTVYYHDGKKFARVYIDRARAERFAERQQKSPVVRTAKVKEVHRS